MDLSCSWEVDAGFLQGFSISLKLVYSLILDIIDIEETYFSEMSVRIQRATRWFILGMAISDILVVRFREYKLLSFSTRNSFGITIRHCLFDLHIILRISFPNLSLKATDQVSHI
jgi:hypothetical protein